SLPPLPPPRSRRERAETPGPCEPSRARLSDRALRSQARAPSPSVLLTAYVVSGSTKYTGARFWLQHFKRKRRTCTGGYIPYRKPRTCQESLGLLGSSER